MNAKHSVNNGKNPDFHEVPPGLYRDIIEHSGSLVIVTDAEGRITFVNQRVESLLGYLPSECEGMALFRLIHPDGRERLERIFAKWIHDRVRRVEYGSRLLGKNGNVIPVELMFSFIYNEEDKMRFAGCIALDISAMSDPSREVFRQSGELYVSLYNGIDEALAVHEAIFNGSGKMTDYTIVDVNPRYEANTGLKKEDVEGKKASEFFGQPPFLEKYSHVMETGEPVIFESWFKPLGKQFRISAFALGKNRFATAFYDITREMKDRKKLEQTLGEVNELKRQLEVDNLYLREEINLEHNFDEIISTSDIFMQVLSQVEHVARTKATVLIQGETGTGKELIARAIHSVSSRRKRPLVKLNCAAIPESLIESELFGHEKGAFTGAVAQKSGRFELADGSTLFLDEIGELPLHLQPKLLRILQDGEFERIGGVKTLRVDVRIVAASNRNLESEVKQGRFRQDLFYRLNVFPIFVPPLRERKEDIPLLVKYFTEKFSRKISKNVFVVSNKTMRILQDYDWPGNVRELENIVERSVILSKGVRLEVGNWFPEKENPENQKTFSTLHDMERDYIVKVLQNSKWKVSGKNGAAEILGLKPTTLEARMKKLGIERHGNS